MNNQRFSFAHSTAALIRTGIALVLLALVTSTGCSWFFPPEPQQPETVSEFMRQPRPGGGIIGK